MSRPESMPMYVPEPNFLVKPMPIMKGITQKIAVCPDNLIGVLKKVLKT
jgi:hypothetical protein